MSTGLCWYKFHQARPRRARGPCKDGNVVLAVPLPPLSGLPAFLLATDGPVDERAAVKACRAAAKQAGDVRAWSSSSATN